MVTADKLGVSCVLPALTCWIELYADHICTRVLLPWVLLAVKFMHIILTLNVCAAMFLQ